MGIEKFVERLGAVLDKTPEIVVPKDKLERVAPQNESVAIKPKRKRRQSNPDSATKERELDGRLGKVEAKITELGDALENSLAAFNKSLEDVIGRIQLVQDNQTDGEELKAGLKILQQNDAELKAEVATLKANSKKVKEEATKIEEVEATKKEPQEKDITKTWPLNIIFG